MTMQPQQHSNLPQPSDEALAALAASGDREAFGQLIVRHQSAIYTYLLTMVRDADTAHDLAQETFVRCWTKLSLFDADRRFRTWLFCLATNIARNHYRGLSRFRNACEQLRYRMERVVGDDPRRQCERRATEQRVRETVDSLPDCYRQVVWLRYFDELGSREIGEILGISVGSVDMRLSRARAMLRERLADLEHDADHNLLPALAVLCEAKS